MSTPDPTKPGYHERPDVVIEFTDPRGASFDGLRARRRHGQTVTFQMANGRRQTVSFVEDAPDHNSEGHTAFRVSLEEDWHTTLAYDPLWNVWYEGPLVQAHFRHLRDLFGEAAALNLALAAKEAGYQLRQATE